MQILILTFSLVGVAALAVTHLRLPVWYAPLFAMSSMIFALYVASLIGLLYPAAIVLYLGGLVSLACCLPKIEWRKINAGSAVFLFCVAFFLFIFYQRSAGHKFLGWDEFSHWALSTKNILADQRLWDQSSNIQFKSYLPGTALLQYYFSLFDHRSESSQLFGLNIFVSSAFIAVIGTGIKRPIVALMCMGLFLFVNYMLGYSMYEIYIDNVLGIAFAASLSYAITEVRSWRSAIWLLPPIIALTLIKHVGLLFSLVVAGTVAANVAWACRKQVTNLSAALLAKMLAPAAVLLSGVAFVRLSWQSYLSSIGEVAVHASTLSLFSILQFFLSPDERSQAIQSVFLTRFFHGKYHATIWTPLIWPWEVSIPFAYIFLALVIASFVACLLIRRPEVITAVAMLFAGSIGFLAVLLASYRYYFSEYEGGVLTSFERYYGAYLLAWALSILGIACREVAEMQASVRRWAAIVAAGTFIAAPIGLRNFMFHGPEKQFNYNKANLELRKELEAWVQEFLPNTERGSLVYFIDQNTSGYSYYLFRYLVAPLRTNSSCWSLGEPYNSADIWTCNKDLANELRGWNILVTYNADEKFWTRYGSLFAPKDRGQRTGIYQVTTAADGGVTFTRTGPSASKHELQSQPR